MNFAFDSFSFLSPSCPVCVCVCVQQWMADERCIQTPQMRRERDMSSQHFTSAEWTRIPHRLLRLQRESAMASFFFSFFFSLSSSLLFSLSFFLSGSECVVHFSGRSWPLFESISSFGSVRFLNISSLPLFSSSLNYSFDLIVACRSLALLSFGALLSVENVSLPSALWKWRWI
jgi:hypothetical protein